MKHVKKILALLLALVMVMGMMAIDTAADSGKDTTQAQETVTIKWYRKAYNTNPDTDKVQAAINEYIEPLIGVNVEIVDENNYNLSLELASGDDVDLFWSAWWEGGLDYIKDGAAMDLAGLLDNYPALKSSIPDNVWEAANWNGHNWYIPIYKEMASGGQLSIPRDIYNKYCPELKSVSSYSELEPYLEVMKADGMTCALDMLSSSFKGDFLCSGYYELGNGVWVDENMKAFPFYESEVFANYLDTMYRYNQAGYIPADQFETPANQYDYRKNLIAGGNLGFSWWTAVPDGENNVSMRYGTDMALIDYTPIAMTTTSPMGSLYMINSGSTKADACLKFLELLYTDPVVANLACFGIEGEHYDIVDGRIQVRSESGYKYNGVWSVTNVNAPDLLVGEAEDKKEQYADFNINAAVAPICGFVFDNSNVEAEVTAIAGVDAEYFTLMVRGFYNPDEYLPRYVDALKAAGMEKVVAEYQTQLDAFLAAK